MLVFVFICILCWVSVTDIYTQRIPDSAILGAIGFRILYCVFEEGFLWQRLFMLLADGLSISFPLLILVVFSEKVLQKEVLGGGDIKLLFVTGMYLGWERNLWTLLLACIVGCVIGLIQTKKQKDSYFPFGPSIAFGALLSMNLPWI